MNKQDALAKVHEGLKFMFGTDRIRLVIARDDDISVICTSSDVRIWTDPEQSGDFIGELKEKKQYFFNIVDLPQINSLGNLMVPVRWQGKIGWINRKWLKSAENKIAA